MLPSNIPVPVTAPSGEETVISLPLNARSISPVVPALLLLFTVVASTVANDSQLVFSCADGKGKFTECSDFNVTAKGGKGQVVAEGTTYIGAAESTWVIEKGVKLTKYSKSNLAIKGKTAAGAKITAENFVNFVI